MKKKNPMMRIAACMIVAVLLTTTGVAGTFAKYTTESKASDFARVAKWGVELQVVGNLYGEQYGAGDAIVLANDSGITVQRAQGSGADASDVVAPGTMNDDGFTFKLNGAPEVDNTVTFMIAEQNIFLAANQYGMMVEVEAGLINKANFGEFSNLYTEDSGEYTLQTAWDNDWDTTPPAAFYTLEDYVDVAANYYPVVYALDGDTEYAAATDAAGYATDTLDNLSAALAAAAKGTALVTSGQDAEVTASDDGTYKIYKVSQYNETNEDLATKLNLSGETITWAWVFERGTSASNHYQGDQASWEDKADTILGNMIYYAKGGTGDGEIVYAAHGDGLTTFNAVSYEDGTAESFDSGVGAGDEVSITAYNYVTDGTNTIACLDTQFSIDIIVTQED